MANELYINLPVDNLENTKEFYSNLGFSFEPQFTNENGAALILGENIYVMLLTKDFFKTFAVDKQIINPKINIQVLNAFSVNSRDEVDEMIEKAIKSGGKEFRQTIDHEWMYGRAFEDIDGHVWEVMHMDISKMPLEKKYVTTTKKSK
jgi:uncharacterized protein